MRGSCELLAESGEGKRSERQSEISQRDVEVSRDQQQIHNDAEEPRRHHVRTDSWPRGDQHGGGHLDDPHEQHERVTRDRQHTGKRRSKILIQLVRKCVNLSTPARNGATMNPMYRI
jgi:hypothetical protein